MKRKFWHFKCRIPLIHLLCFSIVLNGSVGFSSSTPHYHQEELPSDLDKEKVQYLEVDTWSLIPQEITAHPSARNIREEDVSVAKIRAENVVISLVSKTERYEQYDIIRPRYVNEDKLTASFSEDEQVNIELQYRNKSFWTFHKPIVTVARYGNYIVFVESEDIEENKTTLSFIDLSYFQPTLGSEEGYLPIFKMDVPVTSLRPELSIRNGLLTINGFPIPKYILDEFGLILTTTWNIQANLLTYETYLEQEPIIESFLDDLDSGMQATSDLFFSRIDSLNDVNEIQLESVRGRLERALKSAQNYKSTQEALEASEQIAKEFVIESPEAKNRIENSLKVYSTSRKLSNKAALITERFKIPRPMAGGTIREALGFVIGGLIGPSGERAWQIKEGVLQILYNKNTYIAVPSAMGAAVLLGHIHPETVQDFFYKVIDWGGVMQEVTSDKINRLLIIMKESFLSNGSIQFQNMKVYFDESLINKFIVANLDIMKYLTLGFLVPHVTINFYHLINAMKRDEELKQNPILSEYITQRDKGESTITSLNSGLSSAGEQRLITLASDLSSSFKRIQNQDIQRYNYEHTDEYIDANPDEFTDEENEQATKILAKMKKRKSHIGTLLSKARKNLIKSKFITNVREKLPLDLVSPLRQFLFSWKSLQKTYAGFTVAWWKYIFQTRSTIFFKPHVLSVLWYYPNSTNISTKDKSLDDYIPPHPITNLNGGRRPFWRQHPMFLKSLISKNYANEYDSYRQWEAYILPIEKMVLKQAQFRALELITQDLEKDKKLHHIRNVTQHHQLYKKIEELSAEQTKNYQHYVNYIFDTSIQKILKPLTDEIIKAEGPKCNMSYDDCISEIDKHKPNTLETVLGINPTEQQVEQIINEIVDDNEFENKATEQQKLKLSPTTIFVNNIIYNSMNPHKNKQVKRWVMTQEQLKDPRAMKRATKKTFYKFLQRFPEFGIIWLAAAGIMTRAMNGEIPQEDVLVPLTNTSPYWSPYLFGMMFFLDFGQAMLSDFGFKLQEEYKHNKKDFFNKSPPPNPNISFMRWYWQKIWDRTNTYWMNTKHYFSLVWSDIPSYTTMYLIGSFAFLNRIDLDPYFIGYLMYILFPTKSFIMKFDQGLEAAMSGYWYKHIPEGKERLRKHPLINKFVQSKHDRYRAYYQIAYLVFYTNLISGTLSNIRLIAIDKSRELGRLVFFGFPPTVWAVKALEHIKNVTGLDTAITWCQKALTNGYDGWMPSDDGPIPKWLKPWQKP